MSNVPCYDRPSLTVRSPSVRPQSLRYIRRRWNDPSIRGKRVAIDATLLTNVFHFGKARNAMEGMEGKGAIIGWYQLISDMRDAGVKPIAIWDQKGTREWKAAEVNWLVLSLLARTVTDVLRLENDSLLEHWHWLDSDTRKHG